MIEKIVVLDQMFALAMIYDTKDYNTFRFFGDVQLPYLTIEDNNVNNRFERTTGDEDSSSEICGEEWSRDNNPTIGLR